MKNNDRINMAIKVTEVGAVTYVAFAPPNAGKVSRADYEAMAIWQAIKFDETTGAISGYADGDDLFDNVATDLTSLDYY